MMMMMMMMMMNLCTAFMATLPCGSASSSAAKLSATFSHQNYVDDDDHSGSRWVGSKLLKSDGYGDRIFRWQISVRGTRLQGQP